MTKGKRLRLTITGVQYFPRPAEEDDIQDREALEPEIIVQEAAAEYFCRGESHYLFYEEQSEGDSEPFKTRVKRKGLIVEVSRQGALGGRMVFEPGKTYRTEYATPCGTLLLDIITKTVELCPPGENTKGWQDIKIRYVLENQGQALGEYELSICNKT